LLKLTTVRWFGCLSLCHVRALTALCSNGRRYRHHPLCIRQPYVSLISFLNLAYIDQPLHPQILPQSDLAPVDLSVGYIRWQIAAEWLEIVQWSQSGAYRKPPSLFRMVPSLTPYDLLFPKIGSQVYPRTNFLTPAATWRLRQKISTRFLLHTTL